MAISSLGIGSGLDSAKLVEQLVASERQPREQRLNQSQQKLQTQLSAFGLLISALDKVDTAAQGLSDISDARSVSVSDSSIVKARAESGAQMGSYFVEVEQLAKAQSLASATFTDSNSVVGTGTLTLNVGEKSVDINIDSDNNTLADISAAINDADVGVSAVVVDNGSGSQLLLSSEKTGLANTIEITVADDDANNTDASGLSALAYNGTTSNLTETTAARDALLNVNGLSISRAENEVNDVIEGLSLDLQKAEPGTEVRIDVNRNTNAATSAASGFADALNNIGKQINSYTAYNPESGASGPLQGDSGTRALQSRLREGLIEKFGDNGTYDRLVDIGFSTGANGTVEFDEAAFKEAMEEDFDAVVNVLSSASDSFGELVNGYGKNDGLFGERSDSVKARLESLEERRADLDRRMALVEERYTRQFSSLDVLIAELQNTGNYLSSQLANLPTPGG